MYNQTMVSIAETLGGPNPADIPASLIKMYQGVSVKQPVRIIAVTRETITVQASSQQAFPGLEGAVHLRGEAIPGALEATASADCQTPGIFELTGLDCRGWQDRQEERVQPGKHIFTWIHLQRQKTLARLEDISTIGAAVILKDSVSPMDRLQVGTKPLVDLVLDILARPVSLKSVVVYRQNVGRLIRLGLRIFPSSRQKKILESYIAHRQAEILEDIQQTSLRLMEPYHVEDLYF